MSVRPMLSISNLEEGKKLFTNHDNMDGETDRQRLRLPLVQDLRFHSPLDQEIIVMRIRVVDPPRNTQIGRLSSLHQSSTNPNAIYPPSRLRVKRQD